MPIRSALLAMAAVLLAGAGTVGAASQDFGTVSTTGSSSATLSFSFSGLSATPRFSLAWNQDFQAGSPACSVSGNTTNCTLAITFGPYRPGLRQDAVTVRDQLGNVLAVTFLHGIGSGPLIALYPGTISTLAGSGVWGYQNSGNPAQAAFRNPQGIALDGNNGNAYVADSLNNVIRKISLASGAVTTIAGNGTAGFSGDGGPATNAAFTTPTGVAVDAAGNIYVSDQGNHVIRKISATTQIITTVAGGGTVVSGADNFGDGGPATSAILYGAQGLAVDASGNLYIADSFHHLIRFVNIATGIISVLAGGGAGGGTDGLGDGLAATSALLDNPAGVALDAAGNVYVADTGNSLIRRVDKTTGIITAVAGNGNYGYSGDNGPAIYATLEAPQGIAVDGGGNLYIADFGNNAIRQVGAGTGLIRTLAGRGSSGYSGDGGNPTIAFLTNPASVAVDLNGNLYIADYANNVVRKVTYASVPLSFPGQPIGAISPGQATTAINLGNQNLSILDISVSAQFQQVPAGGSDCANGLALVPGASCDVTIALAPSATGGLTGFLKITSNSLNYAANVQTVGLSGIGLTGPGPKAVLSSTALAFANQAIGTSSPPQTVTLSNTGGATFNISAVLLGGAQASDFRVASTCQSALAASASCTLSISFAPTATGARSASLTISDSVAGSPQTVALSGAANGGVAALSNSTLTYTGITGLTTPVQTVRLTNTGSFALNLSSIWVSGPNSSEFQLSTACGSSLAPGANCLTSIAFSPIAAGVRTATLSFADDAASSPQTVALTGTAATVIASSGLRFIPITPCRIADTRNAAGPFGGPQLAGGISRTFLIPNSGCGVPSTAQAFSMNFTAVPIGGLAYLAVWPAGQPQPLVSLLNSDGRVKANAAVLPAGVAGGVTVFATNNAHIVIDINGYFVAANNPAALAFYPLTPCRIADTRQTSALSGGVPRNFAPLASSCNVPSSAQAYSLNFTAIPPRGLGFLSTWPTGQPQPLVSTLNASQPVVTANAAIVPAGTSGNITVYASDATDLVIDINGYFAPAIVTGALSLFNLTPCRVLDTRFISNPAPINGTKPVAVSSSACSVSTSAQAYVLNATVLPVSGLGYLSLWPNGAAQPLVSTLNSNDGATTSNLAIVPTSNGYVNVFASNPTHLILDISAYFAP